MSNKRNKIVIIKKGSEKGEPILLTQGNPHSKGEVLSLLTTLTLRNKNNKKTKKQEKKKINTIENKTFIKYC